MKLGVVLMLYALVLVFLATLDQVNIGIQAAQAKYFESFFCIYPSTEGGFKIPLLGGAFVGVLAVVNLCFSIYHHSRTNIRGFGFTMVHASLLMLIISGFLQYFWRTSATLVLYENKPNDILIIGEETLKLPYQVKLVKFTREDWEGSSIAKGFSSELIFIADNKEVTHTVSMNNPVRFGSWTFYQMSYGEGGKQSILSAVRNPVKVLPWISIVLVFIGMLIMYGQKLSKKSL